MTNNPKESARYDGSGFPEFKYAVRYILKTICPDLCCDPPRMLNILADIAPEYPRERHLLQAALGAGVGRVLYEGVRDGSWEASTRRARLLLKENYISDEGIAQVIDTFTFACAADEKPTDRQADRQTDSGEDRKQIVSKLMRDLDGYIAMLDQRIKALDDSPTPNAAGELSLLTLTGDSARKKSDREYREMSLQDCAKHADAGDVVAGRYLALRYWDGRGCEKSIPRAEELLHAGMARGDWESERLYYHLRAGAYGDRSALNSLLRMADHGYARAFRSLGGIFCTTGCGMMERDDKRGADWFRRGMDQGEPGCMSKLANLYMQGRGVEKDPKKAVELLKKSAELGYEDSDFFLGDAALLGLGMEKNDNLAFQYYRSAVRKLPDTGGPWRQLGFCYDAGRGTEKDHNRALVCYKKAIGLGDARARIFYCNNLLTEYRLARNSERGGKTPARPQAELRKEITDLLEPLVNAKNGEALDIMGRLYFIELDLKRAEQTFEEAYDRGGKAGPYFLAKLYAGAFGGYFGKKAADPEKAVLYTELYAWQKSKLLEEIEAPELLYLIRNGNCGTRLTTAKVYAYAGQAAAGSEKLRGMAAVCVDSDRAETLAAGRWFYDTLEKWSDQRLEKAGFPREKLAEERRSFLRAVAGRNDPCPCGSGLKFKNCCGKIE